MEDDQKQKGLALIAAIWAILGHIYAEGYTKDFGFNTGAIATENGLKKMEEELRSVK